MNPQDLKQGQSYLILATYNERDYDDDYVFQARPDTHRFFLDASTVKNYVSLPSEPPTLVGSQPKHDPCREFRKGDVAEISRYKGRAIITIDLKVGDKVKVCENEKAGDSVVLVIDPIGRRFFVNPAFLELVTPVEELEPYEVTESTDYFAVENRSKGDEVATFWKEWHPNPKEAAEAERDRLNAEHRKEKK